MILLEKLINYYDNLDFIIVMLLKFNDLKEKITKNMFYNFFIKVQRKGAMLYQ